MRDVRQDGSKQRLAELARFCLLVFREGIVVTLAI
jgi:hypothetical protein